MTLKTVIPLKSSAYDVALDVRRHIAYVACYDSGVAVVDMSDPYRRNPNNPYGLLDANGDGVDDRVLGYVQVSGGSRATLVVDSETGLLYIGDANATSAGLKIVGQQKPRMEFLLQDANGQFQAPGYLSAFDGDKPLLGVWLPGGAGQTLTAQLELYDRKGMPEQPQVVGQDAQGNDITAPMTTVYRPSVKLTRQSNKRTEAKYNFYLQNNAPPDAVELAMIYDPAAPNAPDLMVTKQGGILRALATPPAWHHANTPWGRTLRLDKTVSRPWVEWVSDELVETPSGAASQNETASGAASPKEPASGEGSEATGLPENFDGPILLALNQERVLTMRYNKAEGSPGSAPDLLSITITGINPQPSELPKEVTDKQKVRVHVKATQIPAPSQPPAKITTAAKVAGQGTAKTTGGTSLQVLDAGMAVDYNRDGNITFDQADKPTAEKPYYEFWVNDDHDVDDFDDASHVPDDLPVGPADNAD
jgi:hypothetical protein